MLDASVEARIAYVQDGTWVDYPGAKVVLERLGELITHVPTRRMPCLLLVAETSNGKSYLMDRFESRHPRVDDPDEECAHHPVVVVRAPEGPDVSLLYSNVLRAVRAPHRASAPVAHKLDQLLTVLPEVGTRMLVIDEVHHMVAGGSVRHRTFRNAIKLLSIELQIPLVGCGIPKAENAFNSDEQLQNRFEVRRLARWDNDAKFASLVAALERTLPFPEPSHLSSKELRTVLHNASNGLIGGVTSVVQLAAARAIKAGMPAITRELIDGARRPD